jgi:hypothetical protein
VANPNPHPALAIPARQICNKKRIPERRGFQDGILARNQAEVSKIELISASQRCINPRYPYRLSRNGRKACEGTGKGKCKSKFFTVRRLYASDNPLTVDPALFYLWNGYCLRRSNLHTINSNTT